MRRGGNQVLRELARDLRGGADWTGLGADGLMGAGEAARLAQVTPATIGGWLRQGKIRGYRKRGKRRIWVSRADVLAHLGDGKTWEERRRPTAPLAGDQWEIELPACLRELGDPFTGVGPAGPEGIPG